MIRWTRITSTRNNVCAKRIYCLSSSEQGFASSGSFLYNFAECLSKSTQDGAGLFLARVTANELLPGASFEGI